MSLIPPFVHRRLSHRPSLLKIIDNISWLFFDKILRMGVGLFVGVWIARYLGPEHFGILSFVTAVVGIFSALAGLGLQNIVVRDIVQNSSGRNDTLGTAGALQVIGGVIAYGLMLTFVYLLRPDDRLILILVSILGSVTFFKASEIVVLWFESQVSSKYSVWVQTASVVLFAVIKIVALLNSASLTLIIWIMTIEGVFVAVLLIAMFELKGPGLRHLHATLSQAKTLLVDSWPLLFSGIAVAIYMRIDQIMLGQMVSVEEVGIYSVAVRVSEVWYFIPVSIVASLFPAIVEAKKRNESIYHQRLQELYVFLFYLTFLISLLFWLFADDIVQLFFGDSYAASSPILTVYIWNTILVALGVARSKWLVTENLQKYGFFYLVISLIVNVVLNYFLIPVYMGLGAAWATIFSTFCALLLAPALFPKTRISSTMLVRSINPAGLYSRMSNFRSKTGC